MGGELGIAAAPPGARSWSRPSSVACRTPAPRLRRPAAAPARGAAGAGERSPPTAAATSAAAAHAGGERSSAANTGSSQYGRRGGRGSASSIIAPLRRPAALRIGPRACQPRARALRGAAGSHALEALHVDHLGDPVAPGCLLDGARDPRPGRPGRRRGRARRRSAGRARSRRGSGRSGCAHFWVSSSSTRHPVPARGDEQQVGIVQPLPAAGTEPAQPDPERLLLALGARASRGAHPPLGDDLAQLAPQRGPRAASHSQPRPTSCSMLSALTFTGPQATADRAPALRAQPMAGRVVLG